MKTPARNKWSRQARIGQSLFLKMKSASKEKSKRIDLGLAILAATRPGERLSCAEIAAYCDCCPERINQIEHKALARLRVFLTILEPSSGCLTAEQVAWILNCRPRDVPLLVTADLLKPLDHPPTNDVTYFDASELLELAKDQQWRVKVTNTVNLHRQHLNTRRRNYPAAALVCTDCP